MKLWAMPCGPPKTDGSQWKILTKHGPLEEGMANYSNILAARTTWTWIVWKGKKIWYQKMSSHVRRCQYATVEEWRAITNSSRKNEVAGLKQKWLPAVDVSGGESKVRCCKEQYCIGTWNARSMNQGKSEVVKQEIARMKHWHFRNQRSKMEWNEWNLIQMTMISTTVGKNPLEEME